MKKITQDGILSKIGAFVICSQVLERMLDPILTFVIQDGEPLTIARIEQLSIKNQKASLGRFFTKLKERAEFDPVIERILDRYLENRNKLIHHFDKVEGHTMTTDGELLQLDQFVSSLVFDYMVLFKFFSALMNAWAKQVNLPLLGDTSLNNPDLQRWAAELDQYEPLLDLLIYKKGEAEQ